MRRFPPLCAFLILFLTTSAVAYSTNGSISTRYRFRTTGGATDQDIDAIASLQFGDSMQDRISGSAQIGGVFDLDGQQDGSPFTSVYDSYGSSAVERIYHAYVDAADLGPLQLVRVGRQFRHEFESLSYDGLTLQTQTHKGLKLTAYGGIPVHMYETSYGADWGDWMVGGSLQYDPASYARFRFDVSHLKDAVSGFRANVGDQEDTLFGVSAWFDASSNLSFSARFTSFSDQVRDVSGDGRLSLPDQQLTFRFRVNSLLRPYGVRVIDLDGYGFIGNYQPYVEGSMTVTKGFGEHFFTDAGFVGRVLSGNQAPGAFNHGYNRAFLTLTTSEFPLRGMSLSATGDYYGGTDNTLKNNTFGGSFSADQELWQRKLRLSAGTGYYLYRFNQFSGDESEDVQTYFIRGKVKIISSLEGRVGYEYENNSLDGFHTVDTRVTWKF